MEELSFIQEIHTHLGGFDLWGLFHQIRLVKYPKPPFESTNCAGVITVFMRAQTLRWERLHKLFFHKTFWRPDSRTLVHRCKNKKLTWKWEFKVEQSTSKMRDRDAGWGGKYPGLLVLALGWVGPGLSWCWETTAGRFVWEWLTPFPV